MSVKEILREIEVEGFFTVLEFLLDIEFRFFEDLDAGGVEFSEKIVQLAAAREFLGEEFIDFVVEDVAFFFPRIHELLQTAEFFFDCHATPNVDQRARVPARRPPVRLR